MDIENGATRADIRWDLTRSPPLLRLFRPLPEVEAAQRDAVEVEAGFVYEEWLAGRLKVLPKKGDLSNPNNWRGIMLLDAAGKITSSIISERLQILLAREGLEEQCGFSAGRGCADGSFALRMALQKRREHGLGTWALYVDLVKAFDTVDRGGMIEILRKFGVPNHLCSLITSLHTGCTVKFKVGDTDIEIDSTIGVKQGDTIAPILFLFVIQAVAETLETVLPAEPLEYSWKEKGKISNANVGTKGISIEFLR